MIVMKFGGTSVESAAAVERVADIVRQRLAQQPVVVVSAMGKTTNRLLAAARMAVSGQRAEAVQAVEGLREFHYEVSAAQPEAQVVIDYHFSELLELIRGLSILGELTPRSIDAISSFGERLSSLLVAFAFKAQGMPAQHVDSRQVIVTDERFTQAAPQYEETYQRLVQVLSPLANGQIVVMGGFIGATRAGITTTLGRGGSDFTASIVGAGIGASEVQIWTDVDGMLTCDPRIVPGGHRVKVISFQEAAELAYFGAKVLHPSTVLPAIEKNIPLLILNSRRPEAAGTRIVANTPHSTNAVKSIACKPGITIVNVHSTRMLMATGFLQRIFDVFARYETSVDMVSTSEVSVSLTIDNTEHLAAILNELSQYAETSVDHNQAIVCLVGENLRHTSGVAGRIFRSLEDINIRMISQGASLLNVSIVVAESDLTRAVQQLHTELFAELDPAVFD